MKTLYLDIFSGISGDMFLGAMLDLGMGLAHLKGELQKMKLGGYHLHAGRTRRAQIEGVKFDVHLEDHHSHDHGNGHEHEHSQGHGHGRTHGQIRELIRGSELSTWVKTQAEAVFERIAVAEGKIHGVPVEKVHFHEVGAVDSIVDVVGACVALEFFGRPRVLAGAVVEGTGWIQCAHGRFPIPAPATLEILAARGARISQTDEPNELITPTGAALLAQFAETFGPMEGLAAERIGFGAGGRENKTRPNVLRAVLGETAGGTAKHDWEIDTITVLETNLDDINPEVMGNFIDIVMAAGALDAGHSPLQMKKNRGGLRLTVLCETSEADKFSELILRQTSAFGVRRMTAERRKLRREFQTVATPYGEVTVKIGRLDGEMVQTAPEYESCKKLAEAKGAPLKAIYEAALAALKR